MPDNGNLGQLKTQEWQHLQELADQLERALGQADSVDLARFLPPPGTPQRLVYLHELIKTEMEIRCRRQKTVSLDEYLRHYPELGTAETLPADLIYEEFRVRHRHGDKPPLESYRQRFPDQYDQLRKLEKKDPVATIYNTVQPNTSMPTPPTRRQESKPSNSTAPIAETLAPETMPPAPPLPAALPPRPAATPPSSNPSHVLPPGVEGYQLIERIGKGQFGEVYRGLAPGGVVVAVKRILRSMDDDSCQRELKALEKIRELNHPYLLQTHNYYALEDRLVIVMELADGSLRDRMKECKAAGKPGIPVDELLSYFREASEALDYLREQKLAHRDIKPENLLRLKGHAKVADFGVARHQENSVDHTMHVAGTAAYMPPEMWRGEISQHSDQYSLAATWYEMRTGVRPFKGKTQLEIAQQHLSEPPDLTAVPEAEQKVLQRALAKKPEQRYPSCKEFADALAVALAPPPPKPAATGSRQKTMILTVALTVVGSILFAVLCKTLLTTPPATTANVPKHWTPTGWEPDLAAGTELDYNGVTWYKKLTRKIGDQEVVMLLVPREEPTDPKTFYMMENKVWNELYEQFADDPHEQEKLKTYEANNKGTIKGQWRKGAEAATPKQVDLGVGPGRERMPVFRVTVTEAYFFAKWLGGRLPTTREWIKAAGADPDIPSGDEANTGPFEGPINDKTGLGIALGTGPLPVGTAERDKSRFQCRDMAGNGKEWTRDIQHSEDTVPAKLGLQGASQVLLMGESYQELKPLTFMRMRSPRAWPYRDATPDISFRVVLERE